MKLDKIIFILVAVLIIAGAAFSYWVSSSVNAPHEHDKAEQFIQIEKGSSPKQIIAQLASEGVIVNYTATLLYLRIFGDSGNMQAGEYKFPSPISPLQVLKELEKGETQTTKLTIPEGYTRFDIAKRIVEKFPQSPPITEADVLALMNDAQKYRIMSELAPQAMNMEGYLYPSTYSFPREAKPQVIIIAMLDQFKKVWKPEWEQAAKSIGRTPHEIVTIASLIETETGVESERPIVAGIINNRLARNMPLGIDQTNVYIAKMMGRWDGTINRSDLDVNSPYNTRIKTGLPPGPISSVSESAIKAALFPTPNDYLFYVRNVEADDGSHWFYSSAAEFEKGKAKYQRWLERQRQEKKAEQNSQ